MYKQLQEPHEVHQGPRRSACQLLKVAHTQARDRVAEETGCGFALRGKRPAKGTPSRDHLFFDQGQRHHYFVEHKQSQLALVARFANLIKLPAVLHDRS